MIVPPLAKASFKAKAYNLTASWNVPMNGVTFDKQGGKQNELINIIWK